MRNVILWMQQSVDGYAEGPDRAFDWPIVEQELHTYFVDEAEARVDTFLYGRRVFEMMAGYWPIAETIPSSTDPTTRFAKLWKPMPKIVFSKSLEHADWNARVVKEDIAAEIAALKAQPGKDMALFGGPTIAATFMRLDLIDEYYLFTHPVVLGGGTPLFPSMDDRINLRLVETRTFDPGVVWHRYQRA